MKNIVIWGILVWNAFFVLGQSSPFATGTWHKLEVQQTGVYKISASMLRSMGYNLATLNPQHLQIWGGEGGMLPQANHLRQQLTEELAILVVGEEDGKLDNQDYVLFYAEGADKVLLEGQLLRLEKNLYATQNYYFLTVGNQKGKRIQSQSSLRIENAPVFSTYDELYHHETEKNNALARLNNGQGAGRLWIGEEMNQLQPTFTLTIPAEGIAANGQIAVQLSLLAQAYQQSTAFQLSINGINVGEPIRLSPVSALDPYLPKARHVVSQRSIGIPQLPSNLQTLRLVLTYQPNAQGGLGILDYVALNYPRQLRLYGQQTIFRSIASLNHRYSTFFFSNPPSGLRLWDVTDFFNVRNQLMENGRWTFASETLRTFVAFQEQHLPEPRWIGQIPAQNLVGLPPCQLLIVSHERFWNEAQRLAHFRRQHDKLLVHVVSPTQIYHEFSSGRQDVTAIRNFIRHLYQRENQLRYVLLFGDASYDYLDRVQGNTNFVPVYQARESLDPINAYSSEDFYGMMDEHEGNWDETGILPYDMEVAIGRLPVSTPQEAKVVVDKLIHYATAKTALGDWRKRIVFVADDGDGNTHQEDAELLAKIVESRQPSLNVEKIYIDAFPKVSTGAKEISPTVRQKINETIVRGALVLNYTGHGAETGWASENILDNPQVSAWQNLNRLPVFVTATCEYGRYDNPQMRSGAEYALLNPNGGAIALLTTTRPVYAFSNFQLNQALYQIAFPLLEDNELRLGDIFKITKNNSVIGVKNRNFTLLGDPSMRLAYPQQEIVLTTLNAKS
ncbi:MAG: type IX secretion system sortase PorU, partial [Flammeovirgaceae bacterium]|nr:type IX secretion system sortase PorU [Flammeovirgaceae bacterium]